MGFMIDNKSHRPTERTRRAGIWVVPAGGLPQGWRHMDALGKVAYRPGALHWALISQFCNLADAHGTPPTVTSCAAMMQPLPDL
ncbi:hypothetical protein VTN77DRAFT_6983 [Rasamsonia byssochlamydoides]|uniref:uncharacterized protein n=1 Tax=Rasamsonia byssochlamydoides TaxID=89139 RepID=UPI003743B117